MFFKGPSQSVTTKRMSRWQRHGASKGGRADKAKVSQGGLMLALASQLALLLWPVGHGRNRFIWLWLAR